MGVVCVEQNNPADHRKESNKRIWPLYNESLVRRMKDILDLKDIENYKLDLMKQNDRKNGRPFKKEGMTRKRIISLVDRGTRMTLKDHMPDNPYSSELMSKNFPNCNKG